jgi:hypothetical protein
MSLHAVLILFHDCLGQIKTYIQTKNTNRASRFPIKSLLIVDIRSDKMDVLNPMTYDADEDRLRERTKYSQMDKLLLPVEFQQAAVSTGVSCMMFVEHRHAHCCRRPLLPLNSMVASLLVLIRVLHPGRNLFETCE